MIIRRKQNTEERGGDSMFPDPYKGYLTDVWGWVPGKSARKPPREKEKKNPTSSVSVWQTPWRDLRRRNIRREFSLLKIAMRGRKKIGEKRLGVLA